MEEFAAMFMSDDNEIFSLRLHPLQVRDRVWWERVWFHVYMSLDRML